MLMISGKRQPLIKLLSVIAILLCVHSIAGQEIAEEVSEPVASPFRATVSQPPATDKEQQNDGDDVEVEVALTESIYLFTEDGISQKLYNMKFSDFEELNRIRLEMNRDVPLSRYALNNFNVETKVNKNLATVSAQLEVRTFTDGWIEIPLQMQRLVLDSCKSVNRKKIARVELDDLMLTFNQRSGYRLSFKGKKDRKYIFEINGYRNIQMQEGRSNFSLNLLRNTPFSKFTFDIDGVVEQVEVPDNAVLAPIVRGKSSTQVSVRGAKGNFEMSWRSVEPNAVLQKPRISSKVAVRVYVESPQKLRMRASYEVKGFGTKLDHVEIRLPANAQLNPTSAAGYSISSVPQAPAANPLSTKSQMVRVEFDQPALQPEIFIVDATLVQPGKQRLFNLAGFNVVNGFSEHGSIEIIADKKWQTTILDSGGSIYQVISPVEGKSFSEVVKTFEFDSQPFTMGMRVDKPEKKTKIIPVHQLAVSSTMLTLESQFDCEFTGETPEYIDFSAPDWADGSFVESQYIQSAQFDQQKKQWRAKLTLNARHRDSLTLKFIASRTLAHSEVSSDAVDATAASLINVTFPVPLVATVEAATIGVLPDSNVLLEIIDEKCVGISPASQLNNNPSRNRTGFFFAGVPQGPHTLWAEYTVQEQSISVDTTKLEIKPEILTDETALPRYIEVSARHRFDIKYKPLDSLYLSLPPQVYSQNRNKGGRNNDSHPPFVVEAIFETGEIQTLEISKPSYDLFDLQWLNPELVQLRDANWEFFKVAPEQGFFGQFEIVIRYNIEAPTALNFKPQPFNVWQPSVFSIVDQEAQCLDKAVSTVSVAQVSSVTITPDDWILHETTSKHVATYTAPDSSSAEREIACMFSPVSLTQQRLHIIKKMYCQTILGQTTRTDRVVFRVESRDKPVRIRLPENATLREGLVDGVKIKLSGEGEQHVSRFIKSENMLLCVLSNNNSDHIVDISYQTPQHGRGSRHVTRILPEIENVSWAKSIYWELLTSSDEYFISAQHGLVPLLKIDWELGGLLARTGDIDHESLESWINIAPVELPDRAFNRYVFFSFGPMERYNVYVANQRDLVLIIAAIVLFLGSILVLFSWARHPVMLLSLVVIGIVLCIRYPDLALLFVQISVVAVLIGIVVYHIQNALTTKDHVLRHVYWTDGPQGSALKERDELADEADDFSIETMNQ